jgi:hypothetical protein
MRPSHNVATFFKLMQSDTDELRDMRKTPTSSHEIGVSPRAGPTLATLRAARDSVHLALVHRKKIPPEGGIFIFCGTDSGLKEPC